MNVAAWPVGRLWSAHITVVHGLVTAAVTELSSQVAARHAGQRIKRRKSAILDKR